MTVTIQANREDKVARLLKDQAVVVGQHRAHFKMRARDGLGRAAEEGVGRNGAVLAAWPVSSIREIVLREGSADDEVAEEQALTPCNHIVWGLLVEHDNGSVVVVLGQGVLKLRDGEAVSLRPQHAARRAALASCGFVRVSMDRHDVDARTLAGSNLVL